MAIPRVGGPNPAWKRRPPNEQWDAYADEQLVEAIALGVGVEYLPAVFNGHDFGDLLLRRKTLIAEGRVQMRVPL